MFGKEKFESKFVNSWYKEFDNEDFEKVFNKYMIYDLL